MRGTGIDMENSYANEFAKKINDCRDGKETPFAKRIRGTYICTISAAGRVCKYQGIGQEGTVCRKLTPYDLDTALIEPIALE